MTMELFLPISQKKYQLEDMCDGSVMKAPEPGDLHMNCTPAPIILASMASGSGWWEL